MGVGSTHPLATSLEEVKQSYHQMIELSQEAREELAWWANKVQRFNSTPLLMKTPDMVIETDASCLGWRATLKSQKVRTGGLWSTEEQKLHTNCLELTAVLMAVKSFVKDRMSINILVRRQHISQSIHQSPVLAMANGIACCMCVGCAACVSLLQETKWQATELVGNPHPLKPKELLVSRMYWY